MRANVRGGRERDGTCVGTTEQVNARKSKKGIRPDDNMAHMYDVDVGRWPGSWLARAQSTQCIKLMSLLLKRSVPEMAV